MNDVLKIIYDIIIWLFLLYSIGIFSVYTWIALFSFGAVRRYKQGNIFTDYSIIASDPNAPSFSIIAPAYNEGMTIVENVRSLLSIYYHKLEIIIVNDGSKDDSIARLVEAYQLEKVNYLIPGGIPTKDIKQVYKSKNPAFRKLIVVDKVNGGKADALNVGINVSKCDYLVCIDVDCIIEQDAVLKLAKPFMEQKDKRLIACGGVIRLANNCKVSHGKVVEVQLPRTLLGRSQALEYIRAFVLGRMAWSRASGLILISGAFGAFDKEIVLACGGYDSATVGEDMELVVRMRRYMTENGLDHQVITIPDPLCWTEVPEDKEILRKQRNRWMRGTMETLWKHRKLLFNPKYGKLGMVSLPYWFFFEFLGPLIEFLGYIVFWLFVLFGILNWPFFFALWALVIFSSVLYSVYAVFVDIMSQQVYSKQKDLGRLILTAVVEPFYFHPLVVFAGLKGMLDYFRKQQGWGEMVRQGFSPNEEMSLKERAKAYAAYLLKHFAPVATVFLILTFLISGMEWLLYSGAAKDLQRFQAFLLVLGNNLLFGFSFLLLFGFLYFLVSFLNEFLAKIILNVLVTAFVIAQVLLAFYFATSRNLLGIDLFYYSKEELIHILEASGVWNWMTITALVVGIGLLYFSINWLSKKWKGSVPFAIGLLLIGLLSVGFLSFSGEFRSSKTDDFAESAARSKIGYFFNRNTELLISEVKENFFDGDDQTNVLSSDYPFLQEEKTEDYLGPFFHKADQTPNLVFLIIEGLGNAYSNPKGYIGDFTPFLSSLKDSSLVWDQNLSSSGRTFSVLPTILGSLPFGKSGFLEQSTYPENFNLVNILGSQGFSTAFFYGGNASFDFMSNFLEASQIDNITEEANFPKSYRKLPSGTGESWGYEDQAVFDMLSKANLPASKPYFHVALTLSTHNPFLINDAPKFEAMYDQRLQTAKLSKEQRAFALENKKQLVSVLNFDNALQNFFEAYKKRPDFANTIFVITGDHSMPEIPLQSKIDRFHVPLVIYSPLLKTKRRFPQLVSHFDVAPSLLAFYRNNYSLKTPSQVTWIGKGLGIGAGKKGMGIPMMQSKSQQIDFVYTDIHVHEKQAYLLSKELEEDLLPQADAGKDAKDRFTQFQSYNNQFIRLKKLMPDSVYRQYFPSK